MSIARVGPFADPYLNTDAGTMSPFEHGEVFVLDDGGEVRILSRCKCIGHCQLLGLQAPPSRHASRIKT